jgi:hypothetical protein
MSQRVRHIHFYLLIADQWTEPQSPWQNLSELNGVKYLKSHAQILLDGTSSRLLNAEDTKHLNHTA